MPAPKSVTDLIERFRRNIDHYKSDAYKEANVRAEFVDPLFQALGWDMANEQGYAEGYKDVVYEPSLQVEGAPRAPDYSFRVGGQRKFFVEAKKPKVDIHREAGPAYQLRRYAWSAQLAVSILTDFEEFAVYDTRIRPKETDKASAARIMYFRFDELAGKWDEIKAIFAKESILLGSFDRFALSSTAKRGTQGFDTAFLDEIERWRKVLAQSIAKRNAAISVRELNAAVQTTIDRIVFLRIAEDRGIEEYGQLRSATAGKEVYEKLKTIYWHADQKYNSGLFHFRIEPGRVGDADTLTMELAIDDKVLKDIILSTYYPASPYEFSVLPTAILGNVYEQFLGKVIRVSAARHVTIEEKPEVRKAGGVYYTPANVVDYIVRSCLGPLFEKGDPDSVASVRIVDPACGSGSFLLGAYEYLLDWYSNWYVTNRTLYKRKFQDRIRETARGDWRLTTGERKRILLTHLFGVDIDSQAVEVTKLSLLLKVLEGETRESIETQLRLFAERALPELGENIKCGNSLVAGDYYSTSLPGIIDEGEILRINAFNWSKEFSSTMKGGGFDAIIGNPPYVFGRDWKALGIGEDLRQYLANHYSASPYQLDMFSLFMEKAYLLCREGGYIGQIVPNVWLTNTYSSTTRAFILGHATGLTITKPPKDTFPGLTVDTSVYSYKKTKKPGKDITTRTLDADGKVTTIAELRLAEFADGEKPISMSLDKAVSKLLSKIKAAGEPLGSLAEITRGVHPYRTGGYGQSAFGRGAQVQRDVDERPYHAPSARKGYRGFIYGKDLKRFLPPVASDFVKYGEWLAEPRDPKFFEGPRVYSRKILGERLVLTVECDDTVADQQVYITKPDAGNISPYVLAGIMGSALIGFFIRNYYDEGGDAFPQIKVGQLKELPIACGNGARRAYPTIETAVKALMSLRTSASQAKLGPTRLGYERRIEEAEDLLDEAVYNVYGLSPDERAMVAAELARLRAEKGK